MMEIQLSARAVARLVSNLTKPELSPVAEVASKHEPKVKSLLLKAVKKTRDAVPMRELESVLGLHGGTGAAEYVMGDVLKLWERELLGDGVEAAPTDWIKMRATKLHVVDGDAQGSSSKERPTKAHTVGQGDGGTEGRTAGREARPAIRHAAANKNDLPSVLNAALVSGAGAAEVCVPALQAGDADLLRGYTTSGGSYRRINEGLRAGSNLSDDETVTALERAFTNLGRQAPPVVYRGFGGFEVEELNLAVGQTFTDLGFVSTSTTKNAGIKFATNGDMKLEGEQIGILFKINVPKGTLGLDMSAFSNYEEVEILLQRGTKFKVTSIKAGNPGKSLAVVTMSVVP